MFCSRCGTQLNEGAAFCARCGAPVAPGAGQVAPAGQYGPFAGPAAPSGQAGPYPWPAAVPAWPPRAPEVVSTKSRLAVTLLACPFLMVGCFGAHRFYMGKIKTAVGMLLLGVASFIFYFGYMGMAVAIPWSDEDAAVALLLVPWGLSALFGMAVGIWALVDFIIAVTGNFKDNEGRPISKW